jgi:WD40 repeat protein
MKRLLIYIFFTIFSGVFALEAQLTVQVKFQDGIFNIKTEDFPVLQAEVRVTVDGNNTEFPKEKFHILEGINTIIPFEATPAQNGYQTIKWISKRKEFNLGYNVTLLTANEDEVTQNLLRGSLPYAPNLRISNVNGSTRQIIDFQNVKPGLTNIFQIFVSGHRTSTEGSQLPMKIDSFTVSNNDFFEVEFVGDVNDIDTDKSQPPRFIKPGFAYIVNIWYYPTDLRYFQEYLTIHFENGMKHNIPIFVKSFDINSETVLQVEYPNGGETLTPCQLIDIEWSGNSPNLPTEVAFSNDGGENWDILGNVIDSKFSWRVPENISDNCLIRVSQKFSKTYENRLAPDNFEITSTGYRPDGKYLAYCNVFGTVREYNLLGVNDPQLENTYELSSTGGKNYYSQGIGYSPGGDSILTAFIDIGSPGALDSVAIFKRGTPEPVGRYALPANYRAGAMKLNHTNEIMGFSPVVGTVALFLDAVTGNEIERLTFNSPITDMEFHPAGDSLFVMLLNGNLHIYETDNFQKVRTLELQNLGNIFSIAFPPNGNYIALGRQSYGDGSRTITYIVDMEQEQIIRQYDPSPGNVVGLEFNPASSSLVIGSETISQVAVYDVTELKAPGTMGGHTGTLTEVNLSPQGHSIVSTASSGENIIYRTFTYPETDKSESTFSIDFPEIDDTPVNMQEEYLGIPKTELLSFACNNSGEIFDISEAMFKNGVNFKLAQGWMRDTVEGGECLELEITFHPLDTGNVSDTLILISCSKQYKIPFIAYGIPRNIALLNSGYNFGEVCIGDTSTSKLTLLRNDDPVPLEINNILFENASGNPFALIETVNDSVISPGETIALPVRFVPTELGNFSEDITIFHSGQTKIFESSNVLGRGIGAIVELSHEQLLFLPEETERIYTIRNDGNTTINFKSIVTNPPGFFEVATQVPFDLPQDETTQITIRRIGDHSETAAIIMDADPCLVSKFLNAGPYKGNAVIRLPEIEADPRDEDAEIAINYEIYDNGNYNGTRTISGAFTVNSKMFLPLEISSEHGDAFISENSIIGKLRKIGFTVEGDFPDSGVLATIRGAAGLADDSLSMLDFVENDYYWGLSTDMSFISGTMKLINTCGRLITNDMPAINGLELFPNPSGGAVTLKFNSEIKISGSLIITDKLGGIVKKIPQIQIHRGENSIPLNIAAAGAGSYTLSLSTPEGMFATQILIID